MNATTRMRWQDFLNPEIQRERLISAAIYIAAFQSLKDAIIDRARGLFWTGFNGRGESFDPKYDLEVLSRNRSPVHASLDWLCEQGAVNSDIKMFERIKAFRNQLAHGLLETLSGEDLSSEYKTNFAELSSLLHKIEVWWIKNVECEGPVEESDIIPGRIIGLDLLCQVALGGNRDFYERIRKTESGA